MCGHPLSHQASPSLILCFSLSSSADWGLTSPDDGSQGRLTQSALSTEALVSLRWTSEIPPLKPRPHHSLENGEVISQIPFFPFYGHFSIALSPCWSLLIVVTSRWGLTKQELLAQGSVACVGFPGFLLYPIAHHICDKWRQKPQRREVQLSVIYWLQKNSWPYLWETFYETWPQGTAGDWTEWLHSSWHVWLINCSGITQSGVWSSRLDCMS